MKFFRLKRTIELSQLGYHPQVRENVYKGNVNDPKFIDKVFFEKAKFDPITASALLDPRANLTDLIHTSGMGFTMKFLMSDSLKSLFQKYRSDGIEFFRSPVIHKDEIHDDFWVMSVFKTDEELLDFSKCTFLLRSRKPEGGGTELSSVIINDHKDFQEKKKFYASNSAYLFVDTPIFINSELYDIYILRNVGGGVGYYVSEKFKNDLLENEISGIDYEEVET